MQLNLLHLDDALSHQSKFLEACAGKGAQQCYAATMGCKVRLWGRPKPLENLRRKISADLKFTDKPLTFMGSGDFHHITALLLSLLLRKQEAAVTVIHFDNHPDWVSHTNGMHCGSWVNEALKHPQVDRIITIGVNSKDLSWPEFKGANLKAMQSGRHMVHPYDHVPSWVAGKYSEGAGYRQQRRHIHWKNIKDLSVDHLLSRIMASIRTARIYITFDKDVLKQSDATTNWDQGGMTLSAVLQVIRGLASKRALIGADVTGDYSAPYYVGGYFSRLKKRIESWIDQPSVIDAKEATFRNESANLQILHTFEELLS